MILTLSPTVLKISGTVGNNTFSRTPATTYARTKGTRIRVPGPDAIANMQYFNQVAAFWSRNATSAIVQEWNNYCINHPKTGRCGNLIVQSAYNKFVQVNMNNLRAGRNMQLYPPFP